MKILHWFREDLRLFDNPALHHVSNAGNVMPVFFLPGSGDSDSTDDQHSSVPGLGGASRWWLHHSLERLSTSLRKQGVELILLKGDPAKVLPQLAQKCGIDLVTWNRVYSPAGVALGQTVRDALNEDQVVSRSFNAQLLIEPTKIFNKQGTPFKVFTPFWRHCLSTLEPSPVYSEPTLSSFEHSFKSDDLNTWRLQPQKPNWATGFDEHWQPGEQGAQDKWLTFLEGGIDKYADGRDIPSECNTSLLSPHLAFGEISPRQIWHDTHEAMLERAVSGANGNKFLSEIGWREFSRYLLIHFPHIERKPFNQRFEIFPWADDTHLIRAWQRGETGYPIVDAGMRELWQTGYMHNRVRMIVASFLTKHCLSHWHHGMDWFWDTLVDADIGNNTASWQWAAGCGADASPYFRIFNPILQGDKFDPEGVYIKKWLPQLSNLPKKFINKPWEASADVLRQAGVVLGEHYPNPVVDHKQARERALEAYQTIKK